VRASRRMCVNRGKVCPVCGETDPLLLTKDGRCANCASGHPMEWHHLWDRPFRRNELERSAVIAISPNAHLLVSDLQIGHPAAPTDDFDSDAFLNARLVEFVLAVTDVYQVLTYLHEQPELCEDLFLIILLIGVIWFLLHLTKIDLREMLDGAKKRLREYDYLKERKEETNE
jgi:hypothetical protein